MKSLSPDVTYFIWTTLVLVQSILIVVSLWNLYKSKNLTYNIRIALLISTLFIPIIGPVLSIITIRKHNKRNTFQRNIYN